MLTSDTSVYPKARGRVKQPKVTAPESQVVNACIRWLWQNGCFVWRNNSGGFTPPGSKRVIRFGRVGSADIIGMNKQGRFIAIECKSEKGKLTPHQIAFKTDVLLHGGVFVLARSVDDLEAVRDRVLYA